MIQSKKIRDNNSEIILEKLSDSTSDSRCKTVLLEAVGINGKKDLINEDLPNVLDTEDEINFFNSKNKKNEKIN